MVAESNRLLVEVYGYSALTQKNVKPGLKNLEAEILTLKTKK